MGDTQTIRSEDSCQQAPIRMLRSNPADQSRLSTIVKAAKPTATQADRQIALIAVPHLKPEMDLIATATEMPFCNFPVDWSRLDTIGDPHSEVIQNFVLVFCLSAELHSDQQNAAESLAEIQRDHRVSAGSRRRVPGSI
jgi:hypothetical protein